MDIERLLEECRREITTMLGHENKGKTGKTIIHVRWFDASHQHGECTQDELVSKVVLESAGLLIREDRESLSIALNHHEANGVWRYIEHIPKVNVLEEKRFTV